MKKALKQLLNTLDKILEEHEDLGDTFMRDEMRYVIDGYFIDPVEHYTMPKRMGMESDKADKQVRAALKRFLKHPEVIEAQKTLKTAKQRLAAFQDSDVESDQGSAYDEYFGYRKKP